MNDEIKTLIKKKNGLYERHRRSGNLDYIMLKAITTDISHTVNPSKFKYHDRLAENLNNPKTAAKTYQSILKAFVNGCKITVTPPLSVGNQPVNDFLPKVNLFNNFFCKLYSTIVAKSSSLPTN